VAIEATPADEEVYVCPECHVGSLHAGTALYCATIGGQLITVPDFPAWICDVCGLRQYDQPAELELHALLQFERGEPGQEQRDPQAGGSQWVRPPLRHPGNQQ
jgi:YgiT-type zinc finger domain-containing protein